jgi:hypothetical protein
MNSRIVTTILVLGSTWAVGCSSDDDSTKADAEALCKQQASTMCSRYYSCYTAEQLANLTAVAGTSESDCVTQWASKLDCSTNPSKCEAGQTYDSTKAKECVDGYKAFSCADFVGFMSGTTPAPSACSQGCK